MAYPSPIKSVGGLDQVDDILEYFKGALMANSGINPESWPYYNDPGFVNDWFTASADVPGGSAFPMTRQKFYDIIDYWTVTTNSSNYTVDTVDYYFRTIYGTKLYAFVEPLGNVNWPQEAVTHWGKIKTLEIGLFGSVGNGGSLTSTSIVGSGTFSDGLSRMVICDLSYLRYALIKFSTYGLCHPNEVIASAPVFVSNSVSPRRIVFDLPSGILIGDCEYSLNGGGFWSNPLSGATITGNRATWPVPVGEYQSQEILIRVRKNRGAYIEPSEPIHNTISYS